MELKDKVCIVTGSGRGIGRATAELLAAEGAQVVVNDVDGDVCDEAVASIERGGGRAVGVAAPVGSLDTGEELVRTALDAFGRLDVLVNNAGILRDRMTHNMSEEEWDDVIRVHLTGTWACSRAAIRHWRPLAKAEGDDRPHRKIVNVTSASGLAGNPGQANYAVAKAGIVGLTKTWAKELGRLSINVNAVAPAARTRMTVDLDDQVTLPEAERRAAEEARLGRFALGREGEPEDVAPVFRFLASDASNFITGQVVNVDGGFLM